MKDESMNLDQIAKEMNQISDKLVAAGLVHLQGGNFSAREGPQMAITGHRSAKKSLSGSDLYIADVDSDQEVTGASKTLGMHRAIFRKTDAKAIIHAHPYYATLISYYTDVLCPIDENSIYYLGEKVFCIQSEGYMKWDRLAEQMADLLSQSPAAILKWHGSFTIGSSLAEAFNATQALEFAARFLLDTRRLEPILGRAEMPDYAQKDTFKGRE